MSESDGRPMWKRLLGRSELVFRTGLTVEEAEALVRALPEVLPSPLMTRTLSNDDIGLEDFSSRAVGWGEARISGERWTLLGHRQLIRGRIEARPGGAVVRVGIDVMPWGRLIGGACAVSGIVLLAAGETAVGLFQLLASPALTVGVRRYTEWTRRHLHAALRAHFPDTPSSPRGPFR